MSKGIRILHTSDLQLDAPFRFLGEGGYRHRQQLRRAFTSILEMVQDGEFQILVIAGDLFNSNRPMQSTVDTVLHLFNKCAVPVCILPGNHDPYDSMSIYRRVRFPTNVTIFNEEIKSKLFPDLDLAVYGNAIINKDVGRRPLEGIQPDCEVGWHVAMAHGSVVLGLAENPDRPISMDEIEKCGMDYVALGDWHSYADHSRGSVRAVYSGAPEPIAYDQIGAGFVCDVCLDEEGVRVEKIRVGKIRAQQVQVDVSGRSEAEILNRIMEHEGQESMLEVILSGVAEIGMVVDPAEMEKLLSPHFYALRVRDQSHLQMENISVDDFPSGHMIRRFIEVMTGHLQEAQDDHQANIAEQALQLGLALLQGKNVI